MLSFEEVERIHKRAAKELIKTYPEVNGVGIERPREPDGEYKIRVNLYCEPRTPLPSEFEGVKLSANVVGVVRAQ